MKLLLINPDYMKYSSPPLGFIALAAYVRRECSFLDLKFLDQLTEEEIWKQINKFRPKVIGFTAVSENYFFVKQFAKKIKNNFPDIILVLGGIHISTSPESFEDSFFDLAIRGEGEIAFTKLLESLNKNDGINKLELGKVKGLMFRHGKNIKNNGLSEFMDNLDDLPFPARDLLNPHYYRLPTISGAGSFDPWGLIISSRGCPHNCRFCASYALWKSRIKFRVKDFTGVFEGVDDKERPFSILHGDYSKYPGSSFQSETRDCECRTSELLIGPQGDVYRCHRDVFSREFPVGNITDTDFQITDGFLPCSKYGECHPCDVKVKTNYKQELGHTSVEIRKVK